MLIGECWRKLSIWLLFAVTVCFYAMNAYAFTVRITATGDNYIYYYDWPADKWKKLDNNDYKVLSSSATVDMIWDYSYEYLFFAVKNVGAPSKWNPAGLLAQVEVPGVGEILSDETWEVLPYYKWHDMPPFNVKSYKLWKSADWYSTNDGRVNPLHPEAAVRSGNSEVGLWYKVLGHMIYGIDKDAKWIWTDKNFSTNMDKAAIFRVKIPGPSNNSVVPEPSTGLLFVVGIMFCLWIGKSIRSLD